MSRDPGEGAGTIHCREARECMPLWYYGALEPGRSAGVERHVGTCPDCAGEWRRTRALLESVTAAEAFPSEGQVDWEAFARETVARARAAGSLVLPIRERRTWPAWAGLAAAAAVFAVVLAVRPAWPPEGDAGGGEETAGAARMIRESAARRAALRSLREGRALLLDLIATPARCRRPDGTVDIVVEKSRSRDLLRRMVMHREALEGMEDRRVAELMRQVESLLMQVASLEDCTGPGSLREVAEAAGRGQLLLRIDLVAREALGGGRRA